MKTKAPQVEFVILQSTLNTKLIRKIEGQLNIHGISYTEFLILRFLNEAPARTMRRIDLAECVGISASGVTRLLAPMQKIKLVEKETNSRDARVSLVKLSSTGERAYKEASVTFGHCAEALTEQLSANQLDTSIELLNRLI